jgi:hypothetical protein
MVATGAEPVWAQSAPTVKLKIAATRCRRNPPEAQKKVGEENWATDIF